MVKGHIVGQEYETFNLRVDWGLEPRLAVTVLDSFSTNVELSLGFDGFRVSLPCEVPILSPGRSTLEIVLYSIELMN